MVEDILEILRQKIVSRALSDGGFPSQPGGRYRPDATAWAALALSALGEDKNASAARSRLAADQMDDGRVCLSKNHPQTFWPTALAVLAWHNSPTHRKSQGDGTDFLLAFSGKHWKKGEDSSIGHDPFIRGWPWIENTHSWVEPTSFVLIALELVGKGDHGRAQEARRMLLDRQMSDGGWNYGNPTVFGRQLWPMAEATGMALSALAERVEWETVRKSISYLKQETERQRTPLSFGWGCLGLGAWGERLRIDQDILLRNLKERERYGNHETGELSLLVISQLARNGLVSSLREVSSK